MIYTTGMTLLECDFRALNSLSVASISNTLLCTKPYWMSAEGLTLQQLRYEKRNSCWKLSWFTDRRSYKTLVSLGCFSYFHVTSFRWNPCNGAKNSKQRIPGLLHYDAYGTDKLPTLVTGNSPLAQNTRLIIQGHDPQWSKYG